MKLTGFVILDEWSRPYSPREFKLLTVFEEIEEFARQGTRQNPEVQVFHEATP